MANVNKQIKEMMMAEETVDAVVEPKKASSISKLDFMKLRRESADVMARNMSFPESVRNRFIELRKNYDRSITQLSKKS
jgi:molybdate-binding protein